MNNRSRTTTGQGRSDTEKHGRSAEPLPQQQSPSSNTRHSSPIQQSNTAERDLEKKAPCVATMVTQLYNPALTEDAFLAPNIFTRQEILNNCNGRNHINSLLDVLKRHIQ